MRALNRLAAAIGLSAGLYLVLFGFIVSKPLTIGFIHDAFEVKRDYAASIHRPKLVILAGSNGLFSHRCETIEPIIGMPCVNASLTAELGLDYMVELASRLIRPGDVVLMPLEYAFYGESAATMEAGRLHPYRVTYDRATLAGLSPQLLMRALFQFDLRYLIGALAEMGLEAVGVERRFNRDTLTRQGDMRDHTVAKGAVYRDFIRSSAFWLPRDRDFVLTPDVSSTLGVFLDRARQKGIRVIGALPTTFDDRPVGDGLIARLSTLFRRHGQAFLVLPNRSQYPRNCFFDTQYHLNEPCQRRHSRLLARALIKLLSSPAS